MIKKLIVILGGVMFVFLGSIPGEALIQTGIEGLTIGGYFRNQTHMRIYDPHDIMRCDNSVDLRLNYKPLMSNFQFYLEVHPFYDAAWDINTKRLSRHNRGCLGIRRDDYAWRSHAPEGSVGGYTANRDVLSTNVNTPYWRQKSLLREMWFRYTKGPWELKAGKQIVTWGKTDGFKLLDFINPTDLRHFSIDDMEDSKIPIWMINARYYFPNYHNIQVLWIPFYVQNFMAPAGSPWAMNGANMYYLADHFDIASIVRDNLAGPASNLVAENLTNIRYRDPHNENEFAIRYEGCIGTKTNYAIGFFYTHQDANLFTRAKGYNPIQPTIGGVSNDVFQLVSSPAIQRIYGFSFNHTFDDFFNLLQDLVMRGEWAFYYHTQFALQYRPFDYSTMIGPSELGLSPTGDTCTTKRNLLRGAIGFDKNVFKYGTNWLLSVQIFWEHIFDYPHCNDNYISNAGLTKTYQDELTWTFFVDTDFKNEQIKLNWFVGWNMTQHEGWTRPKLGYEFDDHWMVWLGGNFFWGHNNRLEFNPTMGPSGPNPDTYPIGHVRRGDSMAQFKRNNQLFWEIKYSF